MRTEYMAKVGFPDLRKAYGGRARDIVARECGVMRGKCMDSLKLKISSVCVASRRGILRGLRMAEYMVVVRYDRENEGATRRTEGGRWICSRKGMR